MLDDAVATRLEQLGQRRAYAAGEVLVSEGSDSTEVLLIVSGLAKVVTPSPAGRDAFLGVRGPGDLIGDVSAIDDGPRSATVVALEPLTTSVTATSQFVALLESEPQVALSLL